MILWEVELGKRRGAAASKKKDSKEIAAVLQIFVVKAGNLFPNKKKPNDLCVGMNLICLDRLGKENLI